jgi:hypothetical protein
MPDFDNLSPDELERLRRVIERMDMLDEIIPAMREELLALAEEHWPWLVAKLSPLTRQ